MFSSARSCAGENLSRFRSSSIELAIPHEPLLFLYPRWFQHTPRPTQRRPAQRRSASTSTVSHPDEKGHVQKSYHHFSTPDGLHPPQNYQNTSSGTVPARKPRLLNLNNISPRRADYEEASLPKQEQEKASGHTHGNNQSPKSISSFDPSAIDGLALARKLASIANSSLVSHHEGVDVTPKFLEWLVGTAEPNMWFHREFSGCRMHVSPQALNTAKRRVIHLEGSERSRNLARKYLLELQKNFEKHVEGKFADTELYEGENYDGASTEPCKGFIHVNQVPTPSMWTIRSFYCYVKAILMARAPRTIERSLYPGDDSFDRAASQLLAETFSTPELKQFQSTAALRLVLAHFSKRAQVATNLGLIWTLAVENGLVPDISCFNHELERSIVVNNVERVEYLMWNMRLFLIKPDAMTWSILLKTLQTPAQRRNLINALLRSDHLTISQDRDTMTRALIRAEFKYAIIPGDGLPRFANWLHKRFGNEWLSPGAVCDMIEQCIKSTVPWKVHEVLDIARYFGIGLDKLDNTALLDIIRRTKHFGDTVRFFKTMPQSQYFAEAQTRIALLFKIAWSQSFFNVCRLIWRYSASNGLISHSMQRLVITNLAMNHKSQSAGNESRHPPNPKLAAVTIGTFGSNVTIEDFENKFPLLTKIDARRLLAEILCEWMPNDGVRHEQMQLAHLLLEQDLRAGEKFRPMHYKSFLRQLDQALGVDLQWKKEDFAANATVTELLENCITIGLRHKTVKEVEQTAASTVDSRGSDSKEAESLNKTAVNPLFEANCVQGGSVNRSDCSEMSQNLDETDSIGPSISASSTAMVLGSKMKATF